MYATEQSSARTLSDRLLAAALFLGVVGASLCILDLTVKTVQLHTAPSTGSSRTGLVPLAAGKKASVILTRPLKGLGQKGEVVQVAPGYFRNFLLPTRQAIIATPEKLEEIRRRKAQEAAEAAEILNQAKKLATSFATLGKFTIRRQAGPDQKIFGSVTEQDIADIIQEQMGRSIDKKDILLPEITSLGTYAAEVVLHPQVKGKFNVVVVKGSK